MRTSPPVTRSRSTRLHNGQQDRMHRGRDLEGSEEYYFVLADEDEEEEEAE